MALGIGLERFESLRRDLTRSPESHPAPVAGDKHETSWINPVALHPSMGFNHQLALVLTGTGAITAAHATFRYYQVFRQLEAGKFRPNVQGVFLVGLSCAGILASVLRSETAHRT